ncbi:MAG TPA: cell envelope integrity protein CreD [Gemmatimonadaceae bacterium]|nr:cell envelope integrity protein CreD [Gemmatimonadaceae bacterium]
MTSIRSSQTLRLLSLGFLALLLQIPILMISGLVSERRERRDAAITEVSSKWGNAQSITGPALVLPYVHRWTETGAAGQVVTRTETRNAIVLPEQLRIDGALDSEVRHRGIFSVPVYKLGLTVEGEFARPRFTDIGVEPSTVDWSRAHLAVGISDARAIQETTALTWNGRQTSFLPGTGGFTDAATGIHAPVAVSDTTQRVRFSFPLTLDGSLSTDVTPFGETTIVNLRGDYPHPSFQGNWLPTSRTITDRGFTAAWKVSFLGRSFPQAWTSPTAMREQIEASRFGVALIDPVDHYRMAERSVKYAGLFIVLTFATLWLIEVLAGVRVHAIQYLLLGGALCLFFLLELSLSEHLGFPLAYTVASAAVVAMVAAYSVVVLHRTSRALVVGTGVTLLYAYLYLLLMNEDYALLIGSVGLFAILGAIMFATRRVDWYTVGTRQAEPPPPTA